MCDITETKRPLGGRITVEYERRADYRATEVVVINESPSGEEVGVVIRCFDSGKIADIMRLPFYKSSKQD